MRQRTLAQIGCETLIYVTCFSSDSQTDCGFELYRPPGKHELGKSTHRIKSQESAVRGGRKGFGYTVVPKRKSPNRITGNLRLTYVDSVYDVFSNSIVFGTAAERRASPRRSTERQSSAACSTR